MNQEKIGKFIAECRKEKKLTQQDLAEKLGVSDRTIGNWENGRNMPDLSLFKPLCSELDISLNDLMSGKKVKEKEYQERLEENIINTIDYTNKKIENKNNFIGVILIVFGVLISITAVAIFPSESSFGSIYSVVGAIVSLIGISKFTKRLSYMKRLFCNFGYFILFVFLLMVIDYVGVINIHQAPRFSLEKITENGIYYNTLFYDVYRCDVDTKYETFNVVKNSKYNRGYCNTIRNERVRRVLKKAWDTTEVITLSIYTNNLYSELSYYNDHKSNLYIPYKTLKSKKEINDFLNILSDVKYAENINHMLYKQLFQLYDKDNNLILEFTYNTMYNGETKEEFGIVFDEQTIGKFNQYFK